MTVTVLRCPDGLFKTSHADVNLTFSMVGDGTPVVLLHGTSASHAVWEPIATALASSALVVAVDQRGHGRSDKPKTGYDGASFADDVITVLDALELDRAIVAGHSLGARNAWLAASRHTDRVAAVMAIDYVPYVENEVLDTLQGRVAGGNRSFESIHEIERYLQQRYARMPADAVARRARWGYRQQRQGGDWVPLAPAAAMDQLVEGLRTPWDVEFRAVEAPLVCLRGGDSAIVSSAAWERARAERPHARWRVIDGADHYVPEERPDVVTQELTALINAV